MDISGAVSSVELALANQLLLAGNDPEVEAVAKLLTSALTPAIREAAMNLSQQAAAEVAAQLADHDVSVVLQDGDPIIQIRQPEVEPIPVDGNEARITVRLPDALKDVIETHAGTSGESLNTWVIKTLSSKATKTKGSSASSARVRTRIET